MTTNSPTTRPAPELTIGRLARSAGVNVETVRYYQRIGLINDPAKPTHGYRRYSTSVVERIRFIKRAQELGFSLAEIGELLFLDEGDCHKARAIAEHKSRIIQQRIDSLNAIQLELGKLIEACRQNSAGRERCAIIATLTK